MEEYINEIDIVSLYIRLSVFFVTFLAVLFDSIQEAKAPFDKKNQSAKFSFKKNWWLKKWDNIPAWFFKGLIGGIVVAGEFGNQILNYFFDLDETADLTITLTPVALCTFLFARPGRFSTLLGGALSGVKNIALSALRKEK